METSAHRELASLLLSLEMDDQTDPASLAVAADQAFQKLCLELTELVTRVGSRALFARALYLTGPAFPFIAGVRAGPTLDTALEGLRDNLREVDPEQAREGLVVLLATLIRLLTDFFGEDVTLRLLAQAWPDMRGNQLDAE